MADVLAVRDDYRAQTWRMLIQECTNSGLTKREFCRRRGISEKSFYYWHRKLRSQMAEVCGRSSSGPAGEDLGETGIGAEPGHHGQLGDPVCPELAEAAVQAYEAAASGTIRDPRG